MHVCHLTFTSVGVTRQRLDGRGLMVAIFVSTGEAFWACVISSTLSAETEVSVNPAAPRAQPDSVKTRRVEHEPTIPSDPPSCLTGRLQVKVEQRTLKSREFCWELRGWWRGGGGYFDGKMSPALEAMQVLLQTAGSEASPCALRI